MTDADTMPTICAGTDTQPACRHYRADGCWHPSNLTLDLVIGKLRPKQTAEWVRGTHRHHGIVSVDLTTCGPAAKLYEPARTPDAPAFLSGSKPWRDPPL